MDESVLVLPTQVVDGALGGRQGFVAPEKSAIETIMDPANFGFIPRSLCEYDLHFKQLIPYTILKFGEYFYSYVRVQGVEKRLKGLKSLGLGGHISEFDRKNGSYEGVYDTGWKRELREEARIPGITAPMDEHIGYSSKIIGFLNDDSNPVGEVHLGVVHLLDFAYLPMITLREEGMDALGWKTLSELSVEKDDFETWSQYLIDHFGG